MAPLASPALGQDIDVSATATLLDDLHRPFEDVGDTLTARAAEDLAAGKVVGWVNGRSEWGPRALGHRSILARADVASMKDRLNLAVKFREPFRPFAPAIAEEATDDLVDLPPGATQPSEHMLVVAPVTEAGQAALPAAAHVDHSARVQRVTRAAHPVFHDLLHEVAKHTGVPATLNTSFNLKGEPMVDHPVHALATFDRCDMDVVYLGPFRLQKA